MPVPKTPSTPVPQKRQVFRLFRFASVIAVLMAAAAIALVLQDKAPGRAQALIAAALGIGLFVLIGFAVLTASQLKKDDNDPRP